MAPQNTIQFSLTEGCTRTIEIASSSHAQKIKDIVVLISQYLSNPENAGASLRFEIMHEEPHFRLLSHEHQQPMKFEDLREACPDREETVESDLSSETMSSETMSSETMSSETMSSETMSSETMSSETMSSETIVAEDDWEMQDEEGGEEAEAEGDEAEDEEQEQQNEETEKELRVIANTEIIETQRQLMQRQIDALANSIYHYQRQNMAAQYIGGLSSEIDAALGQRCPQHTQGQWEANMRGRKREAHDEDEEEAPRGKYPRLTIATTNIADVQNNINEEQVEEQEAHQGSLYWKQKYKKGKNYLQLSTIEVARQNFIIELLEERCADQLRTIDDLNEAAYALNEQILDWEEAYNEKYEAFERMQDRALKAEEKVVNLGIQLEKATMLKGKEVKAT